MGQALHRARGAVTRYGQVSRVQEPVGRATEPVEVDEPIRLVSKGLRKEKTPEQLATEARWTAKAKILYGQPKQAPDLKARLRAQEAKVTDYRPEPPYDQPARNPYDQPRNPYEQPEPVVDDREWDKSNPNYRFMVQKAASNVATRTVNVGAEGGRAANPSQMFTPRPLSRAKVNEADIEGRVVPGKLNIIQLKQAYLLYKGKAEGQVKRMEVEAIAEKFEVNPEKLKKLFQYTELAEGKASDFSRG